MDHFTIFQDFYRVIAEMTEEEIVSAIRHRKHWHASSHWQKSVPTPASLSSAPKEWD